MVLNVFSKFLVWLLVVSAVALGMSELVPPQTHSYETGSVAVRGSVLWSAISIWDQPEGWAETGTHANLFDKFAELDRAVKSLGIRGQVILYMVTWFWIAVFAAYMLLPRQLRIGQKLTDTVADTPLMILIGRWTRNQSWFLATLLLVCGLIYQMSYTDRNRALEDLTFRCKIRNPCGYDQTGLTDTRLPSSTIHIGALTKTETIASKPH